MTSGPAQPSGNPRLAKRRWRDYYPAMLKTLTKQLADGTELSNEQVCAAIGCMTDETVTPEAKADFLTALAA